MDDRAATNEPTFPHPRSNSLTESANIERDSNVCWENMAADASSLEATAGGVVPSVLVVVMAVMAVVNCTIPPLGAAHATGARGAPSETHDDDDDDDDDDDGGGGGGDGDEDALGWSLGPCLFPQTWTYRRLALRENGQPPARSEGVAVVVSLKFTAQTDSLREPASLGAERARSDL